MEPSEIVKGLGPEVHGQVDRVAHLPGDPIDVILGGGIKITRPAQQSMGSAYALKIIQQFYRIRILGSSALTLCQVASGRMEAFINLRESNRLVDVAAGLLILKEAGGLFFSPDVSEIDHKLSIDSKFPFVACNANVVNFLKNELSAIY